MSAKRDKLTRRQVILSLLSASVLPFTVTVFGPYEIFVNNKSEFSFAAGDFMWFSVLLGLIAFAAIGGLLMSLRGKAFMVGFSVVSWLSLMAFLQGNFLNFGMDSLASDGLESAPETWLAVINLVIWLVLGAAIVFAALKIKDTSLFTSLASIVLVMVIGVQVINMGVGAITGALNAEDSSMDPEDDSYKSVNAILTDEGMFEVSDKGNVIVIILDRFDVKYYQRLLEFDPSFFSSLDGFTYYDNNMSLYSRTYPSITYMLTGMEQDFEMTAETYFETAYRGSDFFSDLKKNGYDIGLYTEYYYAYRNANVLYGIADNIKAFNDYRITSVSGLTANMIALSAYRYIPTVFKGMINVSSGDFGKFIEYDNGDEEDSIPRYVTDDAATYAKFRREGVTVTSSENKKFTFLHLNGCHSPFTMDENGNRVEDGTSLPAIRGVFKMIFEYFEQLKAAGLYEDATIIITGDHAASDSDKIDLGKQKVTSLFVKPSGSAETPLAYSSAPVCQESLRAEIVKSAGIMTENDYGVAFSDVTEDADVVRRYCFEKTLEDGTHQIVEYRVTGDANDFSNWELVDRHNIGRLYK